MLAEKKAAELDFKSTPIEIQSDNKSDDDINASGVSIEQPAGICKIFYNLLFFTVITVSLGASFLIFLQYMDIFISNAASTSIDSTQYGSVGEELLQIMYFFFSVFISLILIIALPLIYCTFLSKYNSFIFNKRLTSVYNMNKIIYKSTIISCCGSCLVWTIIITIWTVYFFIDSIDYIYIDTDTEESKKEEALEFINNEISTLTSDIESPYYWSIGLLLSPVWILFIAYFAIMIATYYKINKRRVSFINPNREWLIHDKFEQKESKIDFESNWKINKKLLRNMMIVQFLGLVTWVFWRWLTVPFLEISADDEVHYTFRRNNPLLSYWLLYSLTTIIKYISIYLVGSVSNPNNEPLLFKPKKIKLTIKVLFNLYIYIYRIAVKLHTIFETN